MPKSERWRIKQELEQSLNNINKAMERVTVSAQPYKDIHPEYYEWFALVVTALSQAADLLKQISDKI